MRRPRQSSKEVKSSPNQPNLLRSFFWKIQETSDAEIGIRLKHPKPQKS